MITINSAKLILNFTKDGLEYTIELELTNFLNIIIKIPPENIDKNNEFIKKAKEVHGNKYDYSKVNYINNRTKVIIICPIHGEFEQIPYSHLNGHGCAKCSAIERGFKSRITPDKFIETCNKKFNNKYDYSKVKFNNPLDKITIICPKHGEFLQTPHSHTRYGCPLCNSSKGENIIKFYLDEDNIHYIYQYKINIDNNINSSGYAYIDFYLPDYNLFIEYNGKLHYVPIEYFGGEINFNRQCMRDNYVRNYCKNNNIRLLEIPYTENNILERIINYINNIND